MCMSHFEQKTQIIFHSYLFYLLFIKTIKNVTLQIQIIIIIKLDKIC